MGGVLCLPPVENQRVCSLAAPVGLTSGGSHRNQRTVTKYIVFVGQRPTMKVDNRGRLDAESGRRKSIIMFIAESQGKPHDAFYAQLCPFTKRIDWRAGIVTTAAISTNDVAQ